MKDSDSISSVDYDVKKLFQEFKSHLLSQNKKKQKKVPTHQKFKQLLCELTQEKQLKKSKASNLSMLKKSLVFHNQTKRINAKSQQTSQNDDFLTTGKSIYIKSPKFTKIRPLTTSNMRPSVAGRKISIPQQSDLKQVQEQIIVVDLQKQKLKEEINSLQISVNRIRKELFAIRNNLSKSIQKQEKYKHISYLSKSIQQQTDYAKILNMKGYRKMVNRQEQTLANLKKFKTTMRKEKQELQADFISNKRQKSVKQKKETHSSNQSKAIIEDIPNFNIDQTFLNTLDELILLLIREEPDFENLRTTKTTRIRLRKLNKAYLKEDRVQFHDMVQRFQDKFDIKIESIPCLVLHVYSKLIALNEQLQKECMKVSIYKQNLLQELLSFKKDNQNSRKPSQMQIDSLGNDTKRKIKMIGSNSRIMLKLILLIHMLLMKFRYMFTVTLTLNMQKKNFQQFLIQIQQVMKSNSIFTQMAIQSAPLSYSTDYDVTNRKQVMQIYEKKFKIPINEHIFKQTLNIIFNDLRCSLILKKSWLDEDLKDGILSQSMLLEHVNFMRIQCEEIFEVKMKNLCQLFLNCMKSLSMNKYQRKLIATSTARDSLFFPIGTQNIRRLSCDSHSDLQSQNSSTKRKSSVLYVQKEEEINENLNKIDNNPRKVIKVLEDIKNQQKLKFKLLNFEEKQVYMYDNRIVIPKYD